MRLPTAKNAWFGLAFGNSDFRHFVALFDRIYYILTFDHFTENSMPAI